jgi:hypothetical protein
MRGHCAERKRPFIGLFPAGRLRAMTIYSCAIRDAELGLPKRTAWRRLLGTPYHHLFAAFDSLPVAGCESLLLQLLERRSRGASGNDNRQ